MHSKNSSIDSISTVLDLLAEIKWVNEKEIEAILDLSMQLKHLIDTSLNKPKYQINILDITNIVEPLTSKLIALLFEYPYNNNVLCRSFIEKFLTPCGFHMEWIKRPEITAEKEKIDIGIKENGKYAVVIENKLKGAAFQRNQLARYIQKMKEAGYKDEQIFVVILPASTERSLNANNSVWYLPPDWKMPNQERKCKGSDPYCCLCDEDQSCDNCLTCKKDFRKLFARQTIIINVDLITWMEDCLCLIPDDEIVLRSAIIQFSDFLKGIYNNRYNKLLTMDIVNFLRNQLLDDSSTPLDNWNIIKEKKKEVQDLMNGLNNLQLDLGLDMIDEWRTKLEPKWSKWLRHEDHKSLGIKIQDFWCGCWCEENKEKKPYWGFQYDKYDEKQESIVKNIIQHSGFDNSYNTDSGWYAWKNTMNGAEDCDKLYNAALELGYLK